MYYLLVKEPRRDAYVMAYERSEVQEIFSDAQRMALASGEVVDRFGILYVDMAVAALEKLPA